MAALRVRAAIYQSLQRLLEFPYLGREQRIEGVRKLMVRSYPYLIYYTVDQEHLEVIILSVKHTAQARDHENT